MKKILLLVFLPCTLLAQVGIGTANPTADLHVAGNTSTIRIESLNAVNSPLYNDGIKPSPAYVDALGNITIRPSGANASGPGGLTSPINFLTSDSNFIPDGPTNRGVIINNNTTETSKTGSIIVVPFSSPQTALIEVKYSITAMLSSTDLGVSSTSFNDISTRTLKFYFCIDLNNDGLDASELSRKYGLNAQFYSSHSQGILGYCFTNGHGNSTVPQGNHSLHFFVEVIDGLGKFTSVGIGGKSDTLKIRIYN
ncbi:MAG TPA: hypothetical protein VLB74_01290 [Flavobacterium sp.]|uniref:hypothetical protein n=1 Tax=Flavobacterium sp. TaxID=239 RepID=UPI002CC62C57|nr:hypothetical protein [Flavobacterium sp.]HSD13261.1 hypothetical protein [Flavobacterium sp.]